ncbi:MAG: creatininase family protein [Spirochaetales bacterium]|nr:creatininase family protein [Spirochaetales bacterium]
MKSVRLQELKWPEVEHYLGLDNRIVLPVGSTEQHGRWLPLGTDTLVAICLAEEAARRAGALVAPPMWFGWTPHHLALPGTISIRAEVLIELLYDAVESLAKHGFRCFVVLNGHRIVNLSWMQIAAERAQRKLGVRVVIFDPAYMSKELAGELKLGAVGHAEEVEGSHMMHSFPELVDKGEARDYAPEDPPLYHIDPRDPRDTLCYVPGREEGVKRIAEIAGGTVGRPSLASADTGKRYHEHLVGRLVEVLEQLRSG